MGVALNRFLGTFIVLENVENRIKTLFWDSHRSGEESTRVAWRRSGLIGSENGGILSLPEDGGATEVVVERVVCVVGSENGGILSLPE